MLSFQKNVSFIVGIVDLTFFNQYIFSYTFHCIEFVILTELDKENFSETSFIKNFKNFKIFQFYFNLFSSTALWSFLILRSFVDSFCRTQVLFFWII